MGASINLSLAGKVALVTGGGSGIRAECARELAALGARVAVADRAPDTAKAVAAGIGADSLPVAVGVTEAREVGDMVRTVVGHFGSLDIAVNSAGVGMPVKATTGDTQTVEWQRVMATNLDGTFFCMHAEIPAMTSGGAVINVASVLRAPAIEPVAGVVVAG